MKESDDLRRSDPPSSAAGARGRLGAGACLAVAFGWLLLAVPAGYGVWQARVWALRELQSPEAAAAWNDWREAASRPTPGVERRPPKGSEPPLLVLLRDHFVACLAGVLAPLTFLYGFIAYIAIRSRKRSPQSASVSRVTGSD